MSNTTNGTNVTREIQSSKVKCQNNLELWGQNFKINHYFHLGILSHNKNKIKEIMIFIFVQIIVNYVWVVFDL